MSFFRKGLLGLGNMLQGVLTEMTLIVGPPKTLDEWNECHATYRNISLRIKLCKEEVERLERILKKFPDARYPMAQNLYHVDADITKVANDWIITKYASDGWEALTFVYRDKDMEIHGGQYKYKDDGYISKTHWNFDKMTAHGYNEEIVRRATAYVDALIHEKKEEEKRDLKNRLWRDQKRLEELK